MMGAARARADQINEYRGNQCPPMTLALGHARRRVRRALRSPRNWDYKTWKGRAPPTWAGRWRSYPPRFEGDLGRAFEDGRLGRLQRVVALQPNSST